MILPVWEILTRTKPNKPWKLAAVSLTSRQASTWAKWWLSTALAGKIAVRYILPETKQQYAHYLNHEKLV